MQNHYNLIYREEEREMMPTLKVKKTSEHPHLYLAPCFLNPLLPSSILASAPSRGPHLRAARSHAPWENAPFAPIVIRA